MLPALDSSNLLEWLTELRELFYLPDHQLIIKGYNSGRARGKSQREEMYRVKCGERARSFHVLSECTSHSEPPPTRSSLNPSFWVL